MKNDMTRNVLYKKLTIGIYADSFNGKTGVTTPYMNFIKLFGNPYMIQPEDEFEDVKQRCHVLLVPGGADVDSRRYGEPPHPNNSRANMHYEWLDWTVLEPWLKEKLPTIGICRGLQTINVSLGGSLFQDVQHHQQVSARDDARQPLYFNDGKISGQIFVNTLHHQALKDIAPGLNPIGFTPVYSYPNYCSSLNAKEKLFTKPFTIGKDTTEYYAFCEIVENEHIIAFQYHPEEINCPYAISKIDELLNNHYGG